MAQCEQARKHPILHPSHILRIVQIVNISNIAQLTITMSCILWQLQILQEHFLIFLLSPFDGLKSIFSICVILVFLVVFCGMILSVIFNFWFDFDFEHIYDKNSYKKITLELLLHVNWIWFRNMSITYQGNVWNSYWTLKLSLHNVFLVMDSPQKSQKL